MRRGDLYWVDFEPIRGSEANKTRPAVVVSNDAANRSAQRTRRGVITVVPVTSNVGRVLPFQVRLGADCGLEQESKAQAEQVRAVAFARLRKRIGTLPSQTLDRLDSALRLHLSL
jgi:mRNA interferase MazF